MAELDTSAASGILKDIFLPPTRTFLDNATVLLKYIEKNITPVEGDNFVLSVHTGRNEAAGVGRSESGTLPTPGRQSYARPIVPVKQLYSTLQLSGKVMAATKSNKGSFLRALESEQKGLLRDTKRTFNRQLQGDGRDVVAFWVSGTGTTVVVDDGQGNVGGDFLPTGSVSLDLVDSDNATVHLTAVTGTRGAIVATGRNLVLGSAAAAAAAGDYFVQTGTLGNQMTGIQAVIDNANPVLLAGGLHGITVAAQPDWVAQVVGADSATAAGRVDLSFHHFQRILSDIGQNSDFDESDVKFFLTSFGMRDTYVQLARNERFFYNTMTLDGGFEAVTYNKKPIVPDTHTRRNRIYAVTPETLALFRMAELDWMDKDGAVLNRVSGRDAYAATLFIYQELACKVRNGNGVIKGINEVSL